MFEKKIRTFYTFLQWSIKSLLILAGFQYKIFLETTCLANKEKTHKKAQNT